MGVDGYFFRNICEFIKFLHNFVSGERYLFCSTTDFRIKFLRKLVLIFR